MLATKSFGSPAPSKLLGVPATELRFRIQGGEHHGRILRIAGAKCTIGSAAGCTLRLRRNDIEPLHCLILSGRNGTVIRRNSPRTYLNGGAFEDSLMQAGDMLRIGSLELVVESCPQALPVPPPPAKLPQAPTQTDVFTDQIRPSLNEQIALARQQAQEQINRLERNLSEQQSENSRRNRELADLGEQLRAARDKEISQRAANQEREDCLRSDLQQARKLAKEWEQRLASREPTQQQQLDAGSLEVESLRQVLASQEQSREQERTEFSARRQEWEVQLEAQRCELVRRQEECDGTAEQLACLQNLVQETRQQFQHREAQQLADQQRTSEESANLANRLQGDIALLTEQLREREAEAVAATQRGSEVALALTIDLDNSRRELHELRLKYSREEVKRTNFQTRTEEQWADLTQRLVEREKLLAGKDHELAELQQRAAHFCAEEQMLRQLEASLAAAEGAHVAEREMCRAERLDLESKRGELESQRVALAAKQGELETRQCELSAIPSSLAAQQSQLEIQRNELHGQQRELEAKRSELAMQQSELESKFGKIEAQQRQFESSSGELEAERGMLAAERSDLQRQNAELEVQRESLQTQRSELLSQADLHQEAARRCEVLETELAELRANPQPTLAGELAATTAKDQGASQHEEQVERWQSEAHKWQLQAEEVAGQLGEFKQSCVRLKDEINELRAAGRQAVAETPSEQPNVEMTREEIEVQGKEVDTARARLQEEQARMERLKTELSSREFSLARFDADLRERQTVWEANRGEQAAALDERSQLIATQIAQFEAEQAAFARQQATMIQQMSSLEDRVQELTAASESAANEVASQPTADSTPAEVDSVVSRLAQAGPWKGQEGPGEDADAVIEPPGFATPVGDGPAQLAAPAAQRQEDDSIEQYMSRLLSRVRGGDSPSATVWRPEVTSVPPAVTPSHPPENTDQPKEYVPRVQAPEQPGRLSQMRELANSAANSAIHAHARQHQSRLTKHKSLVALLSLIGTIGLFIVSFNTGSSYALCGAVIFLSVCCVMCMRAILGGLQQLRLGRPKKIVAKNPAPTQGSPGKPG